MQEYHLLNLGAGIQSTALFLLANQGELPIECAVFADTQEEPQAVYHHLDWLKSLKTPPIHVTTAGRLGDHLVHGFNSSNQRFASIPAYTAEKEGAPLGMGRRQCSAEYKARQIDKWIRRELLGLKPRQRKPRDVIVWQYFGISLDEQGRGERIRDRCPRARFPLLDRGWTRNDCIQWLRRQNIPHEVPRSACVFCPYRSNTEWLSVKHNAQDWKRAVELDEALRDSGSMATRGMRQSIYVHRSARPLSKVDLGERQMSLFDRECDSGCGL